MKKKFLILILVLGLFVCGLCVGVNTYAWDESDDYQGSPIANGEDFLNCSITLPSESTGGEYWYSNVNGYLFRISYRLNFVDSEDTPSHLDRYYTIGCFYTKDSQGDNDDYIFGIYDLTDGYSGQISLGFDVYYYDSNNEKVSISISHFTDVGGSDSELYYYPLVNMSDYSGLNSTTDITYYIEYNEDNYVDDSLGFQSYSFNNPVVSNLQSKNNYQYNGDDMLYLSSFNYVEPIGNQIADVMTGTFSLGTGILSALASYFNVFVLTDGNLSWITIFLFSLLGISLVIGMTRWLSSLIRRKI